MDLSEKEFKELDRNIRDYLNGVQGAAKRLNNDVFIKEVEYGLKIYRSIFGSTNYVRNYKKMLLETWDRIAVEL